MTTLDIDKSKREENIIKMEESLISFSVAKLAKEKGYTNSSRNSKDRYEN